MLLKFQLRLTSIKCKFSVDSDILVSPEFDHKRDNFRALPSPPVSSQLSKTEKLFQITFYSFFSYILEYEYLLSHIY